MVVDSNWTNPENLRNQYLNPKNPTREADGLGVNEKAAETPVFVQPQPSGNPYIPPTIIRCPYAFEFLTARSRAGEPLPILAASVRALKTWLWNPISGNFNQVKHAELVKKVPCVRVRSTNGAQTIVSRSHPVLRNFADADGYAIGKVRHNEIAPVVETDLQSVFGSFAVSIEPAGLRDVIFISLFSEFIYSSGTHPLRQIVGHNKQANPVEDFEPDGGIEF